MGRKGDNTKAGGLFPDTDTIDTSVPKVTNDHVDIPEEVAVNVVLDILEDSPALEISPALEEEEEDRVAVDDPGVADNDEEGAD